MLLPAESKKQGSALALAIPDSQLEHNELPVKAMQCISKCESCSMLQQETQLLTLALKSHASCKAIIALQGARHIVAAEGVKGLYQGLLPTLLRDVPEITIQFALYEK